MLESLKGSLFQPSFFAPVAVAKQDPAENLGKLLGLLQVRKV